MDAAYLREAEEQAGDCALLDVEGEQGVGHVDEEHGAPDPRVGRPRIRVQHYQHLSQQNAMIIDYITRVTKCPPPETWMRGVGHAMWCYRPPRWQTKGPSQAMSTLRSTKTMRKSAGLILFTDKQQRKKRMTLRGRGNQISLFNIKNMKLFYWAPMSKDMTNFYEKKVHLAYTMYARCTSWRSKDKYLSLSLLSL